MTSVRLMLTSAKLAFLSLPEAGSWLLVIVRIVLIPIASGVFYLAMSSGGTGVMTPANGLTAAAAVGALTSSVAAATLVATDRFEGTLALLVIAPRAQVPVWIGRLSVVLGIGLATSLVAAMVTLLITGSGFGSADVGPVLAGLLAATVSSIGLGQCIGALSLKLQDAFLLPNFAEYLLPLLCGVVAPVTVLPLPLQWLAQAFPLTHVTTAMRETAEFGATPTFWSALLVSLLVGAVWLALSVVVWKSLERAARRDGSFETLPGV